MDKQATDTKAKGGGAVARGSGGRGKRPAVTSTAKPMVGTATTSPTSPTAIATTNPTTPTTTTTTPSGGGSGPVVTGHTTAGNVGNVLGEEVLTWGTVNSYSVDDERLMIKLVTGAIGRELISLSADAPHFRSAVSMTMMAYHTPDTQLTVRYLKPGVAVTLESLENRDVVFALEVGIGRDPSKTLSFDDWKIDLP